MISIEQRMILKSIREDEKQTRIEHGQINMLALTGFLTNVERGCHCLARSVSGDLVADQRAKECRLSFTALRRREPSVRLDDGVISGGTAERSFFSKP